MTLFARSHAPHRGPSAVLDNRHAEATGCPIRTGIILGHVI